MYRHRSDALRGYFHPQQAVTTDEFRQFIETFLEAGYRAIGPEALGALDTQGKYLMVTFDDGYFNNRLALDALEEFDVPATFFISSNHVLQNKSFWWDVVFRQARMSATSDSDLAAEMSRLKTWKAAVIDEYPRSRFGESALRPRDDLDRPFTPEELRDFSRHEWVRLGNHTADHAVLTNYTSEEVATQIRERQLPCWKFPAAVQWRLCNQTATAPRMSWRLAPRRSLPQVSRQAPQEHVGSL